MNDGHGQHDMWLFGSKRSLGVSNAINSHEQMLCRPNPWVVMVMPCLGSESDANIRKTFVPISTAIHCINSSLFPGTTRFATSIRHNT